VTEPPPASSPLWEHPRLTLSPHNAAISEPSAVAANVARCIQAFERGEALENVVDRQQQY
jgi:glyoxylate/hydroxypyruvate reductase A